MHTHRTQMMELLMKPLIKICMAAGLSLLLSTAVQAGMYKWTDEQGNVHYSQRPPQGQQYEKMKVQKAPPPGDQTTAPSYSSPSSSNDDPGSKAVADEVSKNEALRKKNCAAAKKNLQVYQVYSRVKGPDGKIRVVSKQEKEEKIKAAKDAIREFCK